MARGVCRKEKERVRSEEGGMKEGEERCSERKLDGS